MFEGIFGFVNAGFPKKIPVSKKNPVKVEETQTF